MLPKIAPVCLVMLAACGGQSVPLSQTDAVSSRQAASSLAQRAVDELPQPAGTEPAPQVEAKPTAVPIEGSDLVRGRATVEVDAPLDKVREGVLAFAEYAEFMPHYTKSKLLGRTSTGARDVYMEIAALHGAVKMWARLEVPKATTVEGVETIEMKFVEGNVKELRGTWRLARVDANKTQLSLEVFLHPSLPLPSSLLNEENLDGAVKGVLAMRDRIEKRRGAAPK